MPSPKRSKYSYRLRDKAHKLQCIGCNYPNSSLVFDLLSFSLAIGGNMNSKLVLAYTAFLYGVFGAGWWSSFGGFGLYKKAGTCKAVI